MSLWRLLFALAASSVVASSAPPVTQTDVFVSGRDGYHTYRIPAILRAQNGNLLAFCEGRKFGSSDTGDIDLVLKRSPDEGRTWSPLQVVWDDSTHTCGNPCPVLDESTGTLWLLLTHNRGVDHQRAIEARTATGTRTVWVSRSTDHGATWTQPLEITSAVKDPAWTWYATGPGVGIQIKHGPHQGRLVIPCDHYFDDEATAKPRSGAHAIFSDDHGTTWQRGATVGSDLNECQVAELLDGRGTLLLNLRSYRGTGRRIHSTSRDGGATWTAPVEAIGLIEPVCQGSIIQHETAQRLLFSNPAATTRRNLTVRSSPDHGATWTDVARLHAGPSAYSCLVALDNNDAGCLYERGDKRASEKITFARFSVP